jgi:hypothetical protein
MPSAAAATTDQGSGPSRVASSLAYSRGDSSSEMNLLHKRTMCCQHPLS